MEIKQDWKVRIGRKIFYAQYDKFGGIEVWSAKDRMNKNATWYFQNDGTELFNMPIHKAVEYLESSGVIG